MRKWEVNGLTGQHGQDRTLLLLCHLSFPVWQALRSLHHLSPSQQGKHHGLPFWNEKCRIPGPQSKRMRVWARAALGGCGERALGRQKKRLQGEAGKQVILRQFQGHVAQSPGLSGDGQDPGEQPAEGGGKGSMRTSLPDPAVLIKALTPTPASSFGSITVFVTVGPSSPPPWWQRSRGVQGSESAPNLLWNSGLVPVSLWASVSWSVTEGLGLIRLPRAL